MDGFKETAVNAIFGGYATKKLKSWLSDCCQPHISVAFAATCAGVDPMGNPLYNISASVTYNLNITGYTAISYYAYNQPITNSTLPKNSGTFIVSNIVAGVPIIVGSGIVDNPAPGTYYLMVADNKGNYSAP